MKKFVFLLFICTVFASHGFANVLSSNMVQENSCVVDKKDKEEDVKATAIAYIEALYKAAQKKDIVKFRNIQKDAMEWFSTLSKEMHEIAEEHIEAWYDKNNPEAEELINYMLDTYIEEDE